MFREIRNKRKGEKKIRVRRQDVRKYGQRRKESANSKTQVNSSTELKIEISLTSDLFLGRGGGG